MHATQDLAPWPVWGWELITVSDYHRNCLQEKRPSVFLPFNLGKIKSGLAEKDKWSKSKSWTWNPKSILGHDYALAASPCPISESCGHPALTLIPPGPCLFFSMLISSFLKTLRDPSVCPVELFLCFLWQHFLLPFLHPVSHLPPPQRKHCIWESMEKQKPPHIALLIKKWTRMVYCVSIQAEW